MHIGKLLPLTGSGVVVVVLGVGAYVAGWQLGWVELMVVAAGCLLALLAAAPFVAGRLRMDVQRELEPARVIVGEPSLVVLTMTNDSGARTAPRIVEDGIPGRVVQIEVPGLPAGATSEGVYSLPTGERGRFDVGPAVIVKADPLGLLRREVVQHRASTLWVHPRHRIVRSLPVGFAKDLEGPTSDTSPQGDVAFHAIREYQEGDDYRHIHWLSTARTGTVMVRHYVDNRRPHLGVLLDIGETAYVDAPAFEVAVEVASSLGVSSLLHNQPVAMRAGLRNLAEGGQLSTTDAVLDRLALIGQDLDSDLEQQAERLVREERDVSAVAIITGPRSAEELLPSVHAVRRRGMAIVVRVVGRDGADPVVVPRARVIDVADLDQFVAAWNGVAS